MSLLRNSAFGWKSVWMTLAEESGGEIDDRSDSSGWLKVRIPLNKTDFTLTYRVSDKHKRTEVVLPFIVDHEFSFSVRNRNWLGDTLKLFGMQDIEIGDEQFDKDYYIQASNLAVVNKMLQSQKLKDLIDGQGSLRLEIHKAPHSHEDVPAGASVLYFEDHATITSFERLRSIHDLMDCALEELQRVGAAAKEAPQGTPVKATTTTSTDDLPTAAQRISARLRT